MKQTSLTLLFTAAAAFATASSQAQELPPPPPRDAQPSASPSDARGPHDSPRPGDFHDRAAVDLHPAPGTPRDVPPPPDKRHRRDSRRGEAPEPRYELRTEGAPRASKPTPFLGVMTAPVPPALAAQLGLPEGAGLVVEEVLPESPAQAAGVKRYDVLKLLNEQKLVNVEQLTALIRSMSKDTEATITLLRNGQEQKVTVKVGEKMLPERHAGPGADVLRSRLFGFGEGGPEGAAQPENMRRFQERMRKFQEEMARYQARLQEWHKSAANRGPQSPAPPQPPEPPHLPPPPQPPLAPTIKVFPGSGGTLLREVKPGGAAEMRVYSPDGRTTFQTSNARVQLTDKEGEIELVTNNGQHTLTVKDGAGKVVFDGPVDTAEQRARVPGQFIGKLDLLSDGKTIRLKGDHQEASASASVALPEKPEPESDAPEVQ